MKVKKITYDQSEFLGKLQDIPAKPTVLFTLGNTEPLQTHKVVSIVGSRAVTPYGKHVTSKLASELAGKGIAIVSGLALGVDALAHQAALDAGGYTAAVLPSPVTSIYPASNKQLAKRILGDGGALISEYDQDDRSEAFKSRFIERNRLVSGLADAILITEASERSGTLHTANFAIEQGKTVLAVPGNITSANSAGTNQLIKTGAVPVTDTKDILLALGISEHVSKTELVAANQQELSIMELLQDGVSDGALLQQQSNLDPRVFSQTLTMLELTGKVQPLGNNHWALK